MQKCKHIKIYIVIGLLTSQRKSRFYGKYGTTSFVLQRPPLWVKTPSIAMINYHLSDTNQPDGRARFHHSIGNEQ